MAPWLVGNSVADNQVLMAVCRYNPAGGHSLLNVGANIGMRVPQVWYMLAGLGWGCSWAGRDII